MLANCTAVQSFVLLHRTRAQLKKEREAERGIDRDAGTRENRRELEEEGEMEQSTEEVVDELWCMRKTFNNKVTFLKHNDYVISTSSRPFPSNEM